MGPDDEVPAFAVDLAVLVPPLGPGGTRPRAGRGVGRPSAAAVAGLPYGRDHLHVPGVLFLPLVLLGEPQFLVGSSRF